MIDQPHWRDRAFYVAPFGWQGQDVLARAPEARLFLILLDTEPEWKNVEERRKVH